jgi:hypothetical protein
MKESVIQNAVRLHLGQKDDMVIFRNNVGQYHDDRGNWVRYGLCPGSSDLIGFIGPTGRFFAAEIKSSTGRITPEQRAFLDLVNSKGGYGCVIRGVTEAEKHYQRARGGLDAPQP